MKLGKLTKTFIIISNRQTLWSLKLTQKYSRVVRWVNHSITGGRPTRVLVF